MLKYHSYELDKLIVITEMDPSGVTITAAGSAAKCTHAALLGEEGSALSDDTLDLQLPPEHYC